MSHHHHQHSRYPPGHPQHHPSQQHPVQQQPPHDMHQQSIAALGGHPGYAPAMSQQLQPLSSMPPPPQAPYDPYAPRPLSVADHQAHAQPQISVQQQSAALSTADDMASEDERQVRVQIPAMPFAGEQGDRQYRLDVVQQPKRARMCGFGDKDRRPITPPPCVRLIVIDKSTGKEVDCNEIEHSMYVLNVDLWSEDGAKEVNLVRHTTATPSISSTTPVSFSSVSEQPPAYAPIVPSNRNEMTFVSGAPYATGPPSVTPYGAAQQFGGQGYNMGPQHTYGPPQQYFPREQYQDLPHVSPVPSQNAMGHYRNSYMAPAIDVRQQMNMQSSQPQGMFTRNLIGSLAASAFRLTDPAEKIGIWFILQDLSVRTEGNFRLRFSFVNVGAPDQPTNGAASNQSATVNTGKARVLAACYSEPFTVFSAKKFPGVCESTGLSKCFATQGIKIPIRKEGGAKGGDGDDDYE